MGAVVEDITDAEIHRVRHNGEWATFALRQWSDGSLGRGYGGELTVNGSYGTFSYVWGSTGCPFKEFLVKHLATDKPYTMGKFLGDSRFEFDMEGTVAALKKTIIERRREDGRDALEALKDAQACIRRGVMQTYYRNKMSEILTPTMARELYNDLHVAGDKQELIDIMQSDNGRAMWFDDGAAWDCFQRMEKGWVQYFWNDLFIPYCKHIEATMKK